MMTWKSRYAGLQGASISFAMDSKASTFYTMRFQMEKKDTLTPYLPLNEDQKYSPNANLPPFIIEGQDGVTWDEMLW